MCPPFQKEENPNFGNFKKGGGPKIKIWDGGSQMGGKIFRNKGRYMLNIRIEKNKTGTFRDELA